MLAHRAARWRAPENTLEAFELAIPEEADHVEFDVRARAGELVFCHDPGPPQGAPLLDEAPGTSTVSLRGLTPSLTSPAGPPVRRT